MALVLSGLFLLRLQLGQIFQRIARASESYREQRAENRRLLPRSERDSSTSKVSVAAPPAAQATTKKQAAARQPNRKPIPEEPPTPVAPAGGSSSAAYASQAVNVAEVQRRLTDRQSTGDLDDASDLVERIRARRKELDQHRSASTGHGDTNSDDPADGPLNTPQRTLTAAGHLDTSSPVTTQATDSSASSSDISPEDSAQSADSTMLRVESDALPAVSSDASTAPSSSTTQVAAAAPVSPTPTRPINHTDSDDYELPNINLLEEGPAKRDEESRQEMSDTAAVVTQMFKDYKVNVEVVAASRGPVLTLYELELKDTGMRVNKVASLEKELALNVGSEGVRIVAPLPNKKTIGVEVPNQIKDFVVMRDLIRESAPEKIDLPLILGRDVLGEPIVGNLAKMPHLLVAGATGMGKSVCLNSIITSLLLFKDPEDCKFILVDPKMVELAPYEDIPHLLTPPITDMTKAHAALEWACKTMDERYYMLRMVGARNIKDFNALGGDEIERRLLKKNKVLDDLPGFETRMSFIVIIVDEYADLMMVNKDVEKSLVRLTAKARACGIHIILTTQRPSADVVTGLIKSNLPSRICFRVADKNNSRVVLDSGGAENLLGKGDMLFLDNGAPAPVRGQGVWVKDEEIDAIIEHVKTQGEPQYDDSICKVGAVVMSGGGASGHDQADGWMTDQEFHQSVRSVIQYGRTGADFLRRKMGIGYNKATGFIETMEELGIVGAAQGTKPRELLYSWDDWIDILKGSGVELPEDDETYINPHAPGL